MGHPPASRADHRGGLGTNAWRLGSYEAGTAQETRTAKVSAEDRRRSPRIGTDLVLSHGNRHRRGYTPFRCSLGRFRDTARLGLVWVRLGCVRLRTWRRLACSHLGPTNRRVRITSRARFLTRALLLSATRLAFGPPRARTGLSWKRMTFARGHLTPPARIS